MQKRILVHMSIILGLIFSTANGQPTITSFSPTNGVVGTAVTITGTGFNTTTNNNIVFFGATMATVTASTTTNITVLVPTGATYAPITVVNIDNNLQGNSIKNFTPVFVPNKSSITTSDFLAKVDFTTGTGSTPQAVAIGDLDGDGKADLVTSNSGTNRISIFFNTSTPGAITSASLAAKVDFTTGNSPTAIAIGDLNGDGKPELVVVNSGSNTISVFPNQSTIGSITINSFDAKVDFTTSSNPSAVAIGDLDGDGKPDLVVANNNSNTFSVLRNTSAFGSFTFATRIDFITGTNPKAVAIGDLDGDNKPDIAVVNNGNSSFSVFKNTATTGIITSGSFAGRVNFTTATSPIAMALGDLDGDTKLDVVVANNGSRSVSVFRNTTSTGTITSSSFANKVDWTTGAGGSSPQAVAISDLNGDSKPDLAVTSNGTTNGNMVSLFCNKSTTSAITTSSFAAKVDFATGTFPISLAIGDLDGDNKPDLAVSNIGSNSVSVLGNNLAVNNADLSNLAISLGTLSPAFDAATTTYTDSVNNSVTSVNVTATLVDYAATIQVRINNGTYTTLTSGSASSTLSLNVGSNIINVRVTAPDGTTSKMYTITVTRISNIANLSSLTISSGILDPVFTSATTAYTASVSHTTASVTVTPTLTDTTATVQARVNSSTYATVISGSASSDLSLNVGNNTIDIRITAQDGTTVKTYTISINRAQSSNADLSALTISSGALNPSFSTPTISYTASVINSTTSITITPTVSDTTATVQVRVNSGTYATVTNGNASSALSLNVGNNTINVKITAQDGVTVKIYAITILRALSSNADLANLISNNGNINPTFNTDTLLYSITVSNTTTNISFTPTVADTTATIQVKFNGGSYLSLTSGAASNNFLLNIGTNTLDVKVTAQDGITIKTYSISIIRLLSSNANLAALSTSVGTISPIFSYNITDYTINVSQSTMFLQVTPTAAESNASILTRLNGGLYTNVSSGSASSNYSLIAGSNTIEIKVTAQDGYIKTYLITVTRDVVYVAVGDTVNVITEDDFVLSQDMENNGTITNITIGEANTQHITGIGTVANLTMNNSAGAIIDGGTTYITGIYKPLLGTLTTGGYLTLKSSAVGTARIAEGTGNYITGNVTVERFIPAGKRGFRFLTSPVTTTNFINGNWQEGVNNTSISYSSNQNPLTNYGTHITGSTTGLNGFDATITGNPSLFQFNNSVQTWNTGIANTNATNLIAGNAYRLLIRGDRSFDLTSTSSVNNTATTLRATGTLLTGTVSFRTANSSPSSLPTLASNSSEFSFIGNPYASPIEWSTLTRTGLTGYYYIWDPTLATRGAYVSCFTDGTKSNGSSNITTAIQSGQAFFVQNTSGVLTRQLDIAETNKTAGSNNVFRTQTGTSTLDIQLYLTANMNGTSQDGANILFNTSYSNAVNDDDATKFTNQDENIAVKRGNSLMSIERRYVPVPTDTVQLKIWQLTQNNYTFRIAASNFNGTLNAYLQDNYLNSETPLNLDGTTDINFSTTSTTTSTASDRFRIVFRTNNSLPITFVNVKAAQKNAGIEVSWNTANELNMSNYEVEESSDGSNFIKATTVAAKNATINNYAWFDSTIVKGYNFYRIKSIENSGSVKYSNIVKVKLGAKSTEFTIYPNPVKGRVVNLYMSNVAKGIYTIKIYNNIGQKLRSKTINHSGGNTTQSIDLGKSISRGTYIIQISSGTTLISKKVIVE